MNKPTSLLKTNAKSLCIKILLLLAPFVIHAQKDNDIQGFYKLRGGFHYLDANHKFVILGYGTIITGNWSLEEQGLIRFTPDHETELFTLYGRHNSTIDSNKIMLSFSFNDDETFIYTGAFDSSHTTMQRIFEEDQHSFTYPYVYTTAGTWDTVSLATLQQVYSFNNTAHYNDFIAFHYEAGKRYTEPFYYRYKNNMLYYNDTEYGQKQNLKAALQESEMANNLINATISFSPDSVYYTPLYNKYADDVNTETFRLNYKYDERKNAYISPLNYSEGDELSPDFDYNSKSIIYIYNRIKTVQKHTASFKISEGSIFKPLYNNR